MKCVPTKTPNATPYGALWDVFVCDSWINDATRYWKDIVLFSNINVFHVSNQLNAIMILPLIPAVDTTQGVSWWADGYWGKMGS